MVGEYFRMELEKNLAQHGVDERILRYKLRVQQRDFPNFIYGNPTSIKVSSQDEENETGLSGTTQKRKCKLRNHKTSEVEQLNKIYRQKNHMTLEEGVMNRKNHKKIKNKNRWRLFQQQKKSYVRYSLWKQKHKLSKWKSYNYRDRNTIQNYKARSGYKTTGYSIG